MVNERVIKGEFWFSCVVIGEGRDKRLCRVRVRLSVKHGAYKAKCTKWYWVMFVSNLIFL